MPSAESRRTTGRSSKAAKAPDKVLQFVLSSPWAISENGLHRVLAVASRLTLSPTALEQHMGKPLDNTRCTTVRDGVATIDVRGPLVRRASWFDAVSGASDYEAIARDLRAALDDRSVSAIVLAIDSPGGEVSGCSELAQLLRTGREEKPIYAYVGGECCSAAYWLASACSAVHVADTALVGNLGVLMTMVDDTKKLRAEGVERITIVSSQTPQKLHDARTEPGRERIQAVVDSLATVFIAAVAEGRGIEASTVQNEYGAGRVFVGADAVAHGLAESVTTYEALLASVITAERTTLSSTTELSMATTKKGRAQSTRATPKPVARAARPKASDTTREDEMDGEEAAMEDEAPEDQEDGVSATCDACGAPVGANGRFRASDDMPDDDEEEEPAAAATRERQRIVGILGYAGRFGLEAVMPMVNDPQCSREQAAARLLEQTPTAAAPAPAARRLTALRGDERQIAQAPQHTSTPAAANGATRMLRSYARVNPGAVPDSVKAGSSSK